MANRNPKNKFKKGNPIHRPKGSKNKTTSLRNLLQDALDRNKDKAKEMLDEMFNNKYDLKWFLQLKASLEPKELQHSGEVKISKIQVEFVESTTPL